MVAHSLCFLRVGRRFCSFQHNFAVWQEGNEPLRVRARIWLGQDLAIYVRLAGVDAPETRGACARERELAQRAQDFVASHLALGRDPGGDKEPSVQLREVRYGKYARRVVARVETEAGLDLSAALLAAGLAQPYDGGPRPVWCD